MDAGELEAPGDGPVDEGWLAVVGLATNLGKEVVARFDHGAGGKDPAGFFAFEFLGAETGQVNEGPKYEDDEKSTAAGEPSLERRTAVSGADLDFGDGSLPGFIF